LSFVLIGDSKTIGETCCIASGGFQAPLSTTLRGMGITPTLLVDAVSGYTTLQIKNQIDAWLATQNPTTDPNYCIIDLGTNDLPFVENGTEDEATWNPNMAYILDAVHTKWPTTVINLAKLYRTDTLTANTLYDDTWIPNLLAVKTYAISTLDERTVIVGHMSDVAHPDKTGYGLWATAILTSIGL
jgi:lysophospholipase L1-like esterase